MPLVSELFPQDKNMADPQTNVAATSGSATEIEVTWTNPGGYIYQELQYKITYPYPSSWSTESATIGKNDTSYDFTALSNHTWMFRMRGQDITTEAWSDWSETSNECTCWVDTVFQVLFLGGSSEDIIASTAVSDTVSATINFSGYSATAQSIKTTYAYYLADALGVVHLYSGDYKGDAGVAIPCYWQSKQINFTDQYKELESQQKNVHFVRLYYVDTDDDVATSIKISTDGGVTWVGSATKAIGDGDGKNKSADFFFEGGAVSGQFFMARIESATSDAQFQWTGLALYFEPGGEDFQP